MVHKKRFHTVAFVKLTVLSVVAPPEAVNAVPPFENSLLVM